MSVEAPSSPQKPARSPWLYVALGCLGLTLLTCLAGGAVLLYGVTKVKDLASGFVDPKVREEKARALLGSLPPGYYAQASMSFFGIMDFVLLVDAPPLEDGGAPESEHKFLYLRIMSTAETAAAKAYFDDTKDADPKDTRALTRAGVNLKLDEVLGRGTLRVGTRTVRYVSARGEVSMGARGEGPPLQGLLSTVLFDCPGDDLRVGTWLMADPASDEPGEAASLKGTVADEEALKAFLAPIDPCAAK